MKTSVTFLKSKFSREETVKKIMATNCDYIHVDIMDGIFVPPVNLSIEETTTLLANSLKPLDIHLMTVDAEKYIRALAHLNVAYMTIHAEIEEDKVALIDLIHSLNIGAGMAINPATMVTSIKSYLSNIDYVLIMGVNPGYGGQELIPETVAKIQELKTLREENNYHYKIALDGGVNDATRNLLNDLDVLVVGSYICLKDDYQEALNTLL